MLMVPLILTLILGIIEVARAFHAYLSVENASRYGIRYAVTGEYFEEDCISLFGTECTTDEQRDVARLVAIARVAEAGSPTLDMNPSAPSHAGGYYKVTVCANPGHLEAPESPSESYRCVDDQGEDFEYAGGPGEYVIVVVDYNLAWVTPLISNTAPVVHLSSQRLARVEDYRTSRAVAPPPDIPTQPPTMTSTTYPTATATQPATPTITFTPTLTPTPTTTPDCSLISVESMYTQGSKVYMEVRNQNARNILLTGTYHEWNASVPFQYVDYFKWGDDLYYLGDDYFSPTEGDPIPPRDFPAQGVVTWMAKFGNVFEFIGLDGTFTTTLTFEDVCGQSRSKSNRFIRIGN